MKHLKRFNESKEEEFVDLVKSNCITRFCFNRFE